eukprot:TRINITY_DN70206_c0_g1_i1.p2 TRINITY_DN70206_c0_g1~~TRINITY_DN70206_c0_g1_i1.p2  ORF type:complete len:190 (+),score=97.74 TRINITY_DN70206_c0_g1_i1:79-570(+)
MLRRAARCAARSAPRAAGRSSRYAASRAQGEGEQEVEYKKIENIFGKDFRPPASSERFEADLEVARRRLQYQSHKRGMLEMDMLLGGFADDHLDSYDADGLRRWHNVLRQYDTDLAKWLILKKNLADVPAELSDCPVWAQLRAYAEAGEVRKNRKAMFDAECR